MVAGARERKTKQTGNCKGGSQIRTKETIKKKASTNGRQAEKERMQLAAKKMK